MPAAPNDSNSVRLAPGKTGDIIWRFTKSRTLTSAYLMAVLACLPKQMFLGFAVKRPPVTTADRRLHRIECDDRCMPSEAELQTLISFNRAETAQILLTENVDFRQHPRRGWSEVSHVFDASAHRRVSVHSGRIR